MPVFVWSQTAATNSTADATINWAEGQAPSSVNDSARAMMAAVAKYRDDNSGNGVLTSGTSTAYTLTTNSVFSSLAAMDGMAINIAPHATCGASPTINVDTLGAKAIKYFDAEGTVTALPAGALIKSSRYRLFYINGSNTWVVDFGGIPTSMAVPIGAILPYAGSTAPNSCFILPAAQAISRTTYATAFALMGTTFGVGDGGTTFNVPDLRGRSIFGLDNLGGSAASRITVAGGNFDGTVLGGSGGAQNHTLLQAELPAFKPAITITDPGHSHTSNATGNTGANVIAGGTTAGFAAATINSNTTGIMAALTSNLGSGSAHTVLSPAMTLGYILRV